MKRRQSFNDVLEKESYLVVIAKKIFTMVGALAIDKYGANLEKEQEVMANLADLLIQIYAMEGVLLRTKKILGSEGLDKAKHAIQMTQVFVHEAFDKAEAVAKEALATIETGEELQQQVRTLNSLTERTPINVTVLKREIAEYVFEAEKYIVS